MCVYIYICIHISCVYYASLRGSGTLAEATAESSPAGLAVDDMI